MKEWAADGGSLTYDLMLQEAASANIATIIDVDDTSFINPLNMQQAIIDYCSKHQLDEPKNRGEYVRCVLESLANKYLEAFRNLQELVPEPITELHIIGGGSQNELLNQLTANRLGIPVIAGPVEATAIGNILIQGLSNHEYGSLNEMKTILKKCISTKVFNSHTKQE
jgi:rhamnulokinase